MISNNNQIYYIQDNFHEWAVRRPYLATNKISSALDAIDQAFDCTLSSNQLEEINIMLDSLQLVLDTIAHKFLGENSKSKVQNLANTILELKQLANLEERAIIAADNANYNEFNCHSSLFADSLLADTKHQGTKKVTFDLGEEANLVVEKPSDIAQKEIEQLEIDIEILRIKEDLDYIDKIFEKIIFSDQLSEINIDLNSLQFAVSLISPEFIEEESKLELINKIIELKKQADLEARSLIAADNATYNELYCSSTQFHGALIENTKKNGLKKVTFNLNDEAQEPKESLEIADEDLDQLEIEELEIKEEEAALQALFAEIENAERNLEIDLN